MDKNRGAACSIFQSVFRPCESFWEKVFVSEMRRYLASFSNADVSPLCSEVFYLKHLKS